MMLKKALPQKTLLAAVLAASALSLAALPAAAEDVVRLGNLKLAHFGAVSYTQMLTDCGIKVEERIFAKGPDIMQAMVAGELDVGATASEAAISGRAAGAPIYIVAGFAKGGARLVAAPEAKVTKVADLKGKKVGVTRGGIQEVLLAAELAQNNLTWSDQPGKDVQIVYLNYPDLNQALMLKQLDAIMQTEPQGSQAVNGGFGVEVMKPYDTAIGSPVRTLVMSEEFHDKHKAVAEKFMRCFVKATKTFIDKPEVASKYVRETLFKKQLSEADFNSAMGNAQYSYDIDPAQIQITADTMAKYGVSKMAKVPTATDYVKLDLLADAKKELGIQ
ncbi:ABC transporter substrate-binding protein [Nitrospirillum sp. BR 11828]|uniref:ABC transporter substrate-binding protein n=1 Tax=Nitrospirillum sp. BR 11828 TaxID=3104325 RepID=UPI002ACA2306|nr:ABC transporter substrate-binding protein [Nitrospirillum sp. BR 11828]MDZ5650265.1 ABC transporter substrate-binding protein [Nitrospirillum sp. BR 11828]